MHSSQTSRTATIRRLVIRRLVRSAVGWFVVATALLSTPNAAAQDSSPPPDATNGTEETSGENSRNSEDEGEADEKGSDEGRRERNGASFDSEEELFETPESEEANGESEERDGEETQRRDQKPLRDMSKDEARRAGFDFGGGERTSKRTTATLMAVTAGSVLHGTGHWFLDDTRTSLFLVGTEGVGLALAGTGLATWFTQRESPAGAAFASTTFHVGAGLFGLSYLLDVVGSLLGAQGRRSENPRDRRGLSLRTSYRYLSARGYPLHHQFRGGVEFTFDRLYGHATTDQSFRLDGSTYGADLGLQWWRGPRPWTFAYLEGGAEIFDFRGDGRFDRQSGEVRLGLSVDLGFVAPHLEQVALGLEGGYGRAWYTIGDAGGPFSSTFASGYLPVELYSHFNIGRRLHVRAAYEKSAIRPLQSTRRLAGIAELTMQYDSTDLLDLEITSEFGGGFALSAGLILKLW